MQMFRYFWVIKRPREKKKQQTVAKKKRSHQQSSAVRGDETTVYFTMYRISRLQSETTKYAANGHTTTTQSASERTRASAHALKNLI